MAAFTDAELTFLRSARLLGRIARDGTTIEVGGRDMEKSKKFRDAARSGRAALVKTLT